ncbi:MAG: ComEC/Rec2 family competence protein [Phycisphaerae bacterium]|nr:ComEC/Rec2 family competence protein [Phycisphaerae bacterium]
MNGRGFDRDRLIRHNLERFLPEAEPLNRWERLAASTPLLLPAIAFITGIFVQAFFDLPLWVGVGISILTALVFVYSLFISKASLRRLIISCVAAVAAFAAAGMLRYAAFALQEPEHVVRLTGTERRLATLEGVIISPIHHDERTTWTFADYFPTPPQSSFYLSVRALETPEGPRAASGLVRVQVAEIARHLAQGDRVRLYCWLSGFDGPANPGQFDMQAYMHRNGVLLGASVPAADGVEVLAHRQCGVIAGLRQLFKGYTSGALFEEADYPHETASLAAALLLGERGDLDAKTYAAFQRTGLAHFISLSGMHVGILAGSLWGLSRFLGVPKPMRAAVCLVLLLSYGLVVPPRAPTVRAIFLACFFFSAVMINRRTRPLNTLALSALVLLAVRPADVFTASWQLSFTTVLGIILLYDPIYQRLLSWTVFKAVERLPERLTQRTAVQWTLKGGDAFVRLLSVGFAAWLGGAGFLLYHFHSINPLSALWTVLATPFVLVILYAGYLKIVLAPLFPTAAMLFALLLDIACRGLSSIVSAFSTVGWSELLIGKTSVWAITGGYAVLLMMRLAPRRIAVKICLVLPVLFGPLSWMQFQNGRDTLTMTCLSVGHGQAVCLSFPDKMQWLVDAGSISVKDPGGREVLPYYRYRGVNRLDAAILTHGDMDHLNGLPEVVSTLPTAGVYANAGVFDKAKTSSSASYLIQQLNTLGAELQPIESLDTLPKNVTVTMLWPDEETAAHTALDDNDRSQVIWIEYAGRSLLLCGDIELYAQNAILERYPSLRADVIVLPHHGSTNNLNTGFVAAFDPKIVIASCAAGRVENAFRSDAESGIATFYTPIDGAVTVNIKADGALSAIGFKSQTTVHLH